MGPDRGAQGRFKPVGPLEALLQYGGGIVFGPHMHRADQIGVEGGDLRLKGHRVAEQLDRFLGIAAVDQSAGQTAMSLGILRVESDRLAVGVDRRFDLAVVL